jgi:hypothetical protein
MRKFIKTFESFGKKGKEDFIIMYRLNMYNISSYDYLNVIKSVYEDKFNGFNEVYHIDFNKFKIEVNFHDIKSVMYEYMKVKIFVLEGDKDFLLEKLSSDIYSEYYYDYDMKEDVYLNFQEIITELNHQTPDVLGVNQQGFGQGAHVGNWGVNFGNPSQGVRGHFGEKGDKTSPNLPQKTKQHEFPTVVLDPTTGEMLMQDDIQDLINQYQIKVKQNSDTSIELGTIDSQTIEFIQKYLQT